MWWRVAPGASRPEPSLDPPGASRSSMRRRRGSSVATSMAATARPVALEAPAAIPAEARRVERPGAPPAARLASWVASSWAVPSASSAVRVPSSACAISPADRQATPSPTPLVDSVPWSVAVARARPVELCGAGRRAALAVARVRRQPVQGPAQPAARADQARQHVLVLPVGPPPRQARPPPLGPQAQRRDGSPEAPDEAR